MRRRRWVLALLVACLGLALSGCSLFTDRGGTIGLTGDINGSNGLNYDGEIVNSGQGDPPRFTNVSVYLYTEDGKLIHRENIGVLERRAEVSLHTDRIPTYIVIDSPQFWEMHTEVRYYELVDRDKMIYATNITTSRSESPVDLP